MMSTLLGIVLFPQHIWQASHLGIISSSGSSLSLGDLIQNFFIYLCQENRPNSMQCNTIWGSVYQLQIQNVIVGRLWTRSLLYAIPIGDGGISHESRRWKTKGRIRTKQELVLTLERWSPELPLPSISFISLYFSLFVPLFLFLSFAFSFVKR